MASVQEGGAGGDRAILLPSGSRTHVRRQVPPMVRRRPRRSGLIAGKGAWRKGSRALSATVLSLLVSCSDGGPVSPSLPTNGFMSAVIDGSEWQATSDLELTSRPDTDEITVLGQSEGVSLRLRFSAQPGTGPRSTESEGDEWLLASLVTDHGAWVANPDGGSGSVDVTTITDETVAGTFTLDLVWHLLGVTNPYPEPVIRQLEGEFEVRL